MPKKIPTLLGLILLVMLIGFLSIAVNIAQENPIKAFKTQDPRDIRISNITDNSFTVSWITNEPATGLVKLADKLFSSKSCYDDRDMQGKIGKYYTHSATCKQMKPTSQYTFKIISNGKAYSNKSDVFSVYTAPVAQQIISGFEPAFGIVLHQDNSPAAHSIVYITLEKAQTFSVLANESGSWLMPLNIVRSEDLTRFISLSGDRLTEYVSIKNQVDESIAVTDTLNDSPVPTMIIGKTYDFRKQQAAKKNLIADLIETANNTQPGIPESEQVLGVESPQSEPSSNFPIAIIKPVNGSSLISDKPLFEGTAIPNQPITLTIGITDPTSVSLKTAGNGIWLYTLPQSLAPGKQTVTLTANDINNRPVAVTNTFSILKSGTQVLGTATPSATIAITPRPTISRTPTPTPSPVLTAEPPPETGSWLPTLLILAASFIFLTSGLVLYIK